MSLLIVNFGGPRSQEEIESFLIELLTDPDVIQTPLPRFIERRFFTRIAKKRALKIAEDYQLIGGKSPIYDDTEAIAEEVRKRLHQPVSVFHRYLPNTHTAFLEKFKNNSIEEVAVFPLFPQFSYATTGSIARWLAQRLPEINFRWIRSYAAHPDYIQSFGRTMDDALRTFDWKEEEVIFLFSAHGLPQKFIDGGDPYQTECCQTFDGIKALFPKALSFLAYQSKFGRQKWIGPATLDFCMELASYAEGRKKVLVVPLSFTSDHVETLFEVEYQYLPILKENGFEARRCPALNRRGDWMDAICSIISKAEEKLSTEMLYRA